MLRVIFGIMLMVAMLGMLRPLFRGEADIDYDAHTMFESNDTLALTF